MSRAVSTDLSEFIKFLRRGNKYSPTTQAVLPSGVRWVFQHFDGEWPPDGIAVAWPAHPGESGLMSFIVNQDGSVYQKYLPPNTAAIA